MSAEPGWYPDPGGGHERRYWDGEQWTPGVADGDVVVEDDLPPIEEARPRAGAVAVDARADLPPRSLWWTFGGLIAAAGLSVVGALIGVAIAPHTRALRLATGEAGLWLGLIGTAVVVSRRYGTGSVRRDYGAWVMGADVLRGFLLSLLARLAAIVVLVPLLLINRHFIQGDATPFRLVRRDGAAVAVLAVLAVVGAPIVEELFFRGLLLRALRSVVASPVAVGMQAVVFGLCHVNPIYGLRNVGVVAAIGVFGVVVGMAAERYRRLGPGMFAHACFNLLAVSVLLLR